MKDNIDINELINNFIVNVENDNSHEHVLITVDELLNGDEELPIIHSATNFISVLIGYLEYTEEYELCGELVNNRKDVESKLIPLPEFCTKNQDLINALRTRFKKDNFNGEDFGL